ncbi:hypothetical protein [Chromatium okenii]|uniref:hypothetical protein n=1 Tax=Chromatium okenii TaxID=61644 RepID=UPI0011B0301C
MNYQGHPVGVVEFGLSFDQTFFERFKQNFNADVALQVIDKNGLNLLPERLTAVARLLRNSCKAASPANAAAPA